MPDPYETLGVPATASIRIIKKSYRQLILRWHPDKCTDSRAKEVFGQVQQAYATIRAQRLSQGEPPEPTERPQKPPSRCQPESESHWSSEELSEDDVDWWGSDDDWMENGTEHRPPAPVQEVREPKPVPVIHPSVHMSDDTVGQWVSPDRPEIDQIKIAQSKPMVQWFAAPMCGPACGDSESDGGMSFSSGHEDWWGSDDEYLEGESAAAEHALYEGESAAAEHTLYEGAAAAEHTPFEDDAAVHMALYEGGAAAQHMGGAAAQHMGGAAAQHMGGAAAQHMGGAAAQHMGSYHPANDELSAVPQQSNGENPCNSMPLTSSCDGVPVDVSRCWVPPDALEEVVKAQSIWLSEMESRIQDCDESPVTSLLHSMVPPQSFLFRAKAAHESGVAGALFASPPLHKEVCTPERIPEKLDVGSMSKPARGELEDAASDWEQGSVSADEDWWGSDDGYLESEHTKMDCTNVHLGAPSEGSVALLTGRSMAYLGALSEDSAPAMCDPGASGEQSFDDSVKPSIGLALSESSKEVVASGSLGAVVCEGTGGLESKYVVDQCSEGEQEDDSRSDSSSDRDWWGSDDGNL